MGRLDVRFLIQDTRAKVYLLWAAIVAVGYTLTQYNQTKNINFIWFGLSLLGFYYMYETMPLGVIQMRKIFAAWLVPISFGLAVSIVVAHAWALTGLISYLGVFWLLVTSVGFIVNGLVDRPAFWYFASAGVCIAGAGLCYFVDAFLVAQYLVAAIVSVWAMLNLFIFRADQI